VPLSCGASGRRGAAIVVVALAASIAAAVPAAAAPLVSASVGFEWVIGGVPALTVPGDGATGATTGDTSASLGAGTVFNGGPPTCEGLAPVKPGGQDTLVLVAPVEIIDGLVDFSGAFGVLRLTYVPEPRTLTLLALGVLAFAAAAPQRK
jgi:hypothetical protein